MSTVRRHLVGCGFAIGLTTLAVPAAAQWTHVPTPGLPRTADGTPDLAAPTPRAADGRPDLSGFWQLRPGSYVVNLPQDLSPSDIQPWARQRFEEHVDAFAKDPSCFLPAGPRYYITGSPKFVQTPTVLVILNEDLTYRQVFLDGRTLPDDPNPTYMGYSVGRWEGDTLIVDSAGLNDRTLLDTGGHPHTERLRITERFHRVDVGHMDVQVTFEDPEIYARPMTVSEHAQLIPDDDVIEYVCRENEKDYTHINGHASDARIDVPAATLAAFAGRYEIPASNRAAARVVTVSSGPDGLAIDQWPWTPGALRGPLVPVSEAAFTGYFGWRLHFVREGERIVAVVFEAPEPGVTDVTAVRR